MEDRPFFETAAEFITTAWRPTSGTCLLLFDDEDQRVRIGHTTRPVGPFLLDQRKGTWRKHLALMGFCDGLSTEFRDELVAMCKDFRRSVGFEYDDTFLELAQAFNAVGRLKDPEKRDSHFNRSRLSLSCPPTDEQWTWAVKHVEHDELPALLYARKAVMECHGDPSSRHRVYRPHRTSDTGKVYEYILLNGPCYRSELRDNFSADPSSIDQAVVRLYKQGWVRRVERSCYEAVKYHDDLPLPWSVRMQDPTAEHKRERNHPRNHREKNKIRRRPSEVAVE